MGMLSKKRARPRINKRNKRKEHKVKEKSQNIPTDAGSLWSSDKTVKQNFQALGIVQNNKPSMRQTKTGKALLGKARLRLNRAFYEKMGIDLDQNEELDEYDAMEKEEAEAGGQKDLTDVFPELKSASQTTMKPTVRKLKADEKAICEKLIKKYGLEAHARMMKDIKINYLQWSKGQIAKNIELYRIAKGEIEAKYKEE